jgi:hypothetical protein
MLKNTLPKKRQGTSQVIAEAEAVSATTNETTATTDKNESAVLPQLLSEKAAAAYLGVSVPFLRRARCTGAPGGRTGGPLFVRMTGFGLKNGKNNGRILYAKDDLDNWLANLERRRVV